MVFIRFISLRRIEKEPTRTNLLVINEDENDGKEPFLGSRPRRPHSQPPPLANKSKGK